MRERLADFLGEDKRTLKEIYTIEEEGIFVIVCDEVLECMRDRSMFSIELRRDEENDDLKVLMRYLI